MDSPGSTDTPAEDDAGNTHDTPYAVLAEVTCRWGEGDDHATAVIVHARGGMLILEAADQRRILPPLGTEMVVSGKGEPITGRLAEHGRLGRFLVSVGDRPVRRALRLRVSLPGTLRSPSLPGPLAVEIVDLTTAGARVRGVTLPADSPVTLDFTPPARDQPVMVKARVVAHATRSADQPSVGVVFRLVALRGGR